MGIMVGRSQFDWRTRGDERYLPIFAVMVFIAVIGMFKFQVWLRELPASVMKLD